LPVKIEDPVIIKLPVIIKVSALLENKVDPAVPLRFVEPVTFKLPDIIALPVKGNTGNVFKAKEAVVALEALIA
jgi:hypothetical protein